MNEYSFSDKEMRSLVKILRKQVEHLDPSLDVFQLFLEKYVHSVMTIEEAEIFFNEE